MRDDAADVPRVLAHTAPGAAILARSVHKMKKHTAHILFTSTFLSRATVNGTAHIDTPGAAAKRVMATHTDDFTLHETTEDAAEWRMST